MAAAKVTPGVFDPDKDNWDNYREQLFFALEAAGPLTCVQKRALFLSQCGKEAYTLIVSLLKPEKPSEVTFERIIEVLNRFFAPVSHPILEVDKFYKRKQKPHESITHYIAALRNIGAGCGFDNTGRRIIEQLILGTRHSDLKRDLLKIPLRELSYDVVVTHARSFEALNNGMSELLASSEGEMSQSKLKQDSCEPMEINRVNSSSKQCIHCAKHHGDYVCRFKNATCYKCHKKGHTKAACAMVSKVTKHRVNECKDDSDSDSEKKEICGCANDNKTDPIVVEVMINGVPIRMEVDSGSARSIIPHSMILQNKASFSSPLLPFNRKLVTWTDSVLEVKGTMMVDVVFRNRRANLELVVSCGKGPPLLGRSWFDALGISLLGINMVNVNEDKTDFVKKFPQLFDNDLSVYCGPLVHIECKEDVKPVFLRARPVPFPLRTKVNEELKRLIKSGILTPVKHSKWATPLTIVPKPDGSLRLCGDYRSTVNSVCVPDNYPLPTANEAFFDLSGGRFYSKIDLKQAYSQLKVDDDTAELLTLNTPLGLMRMNRLAYGVNAATAIFQRMMVSLLAGIDGVACLLDDIAVCGYTMQEHDARVNEVLQRLSNIGLKLNKEKCVFATRKITFLGYEIDEQGVHPSSEKVEEIANKTSPKDKRSLKAFLGLYNFYERFLKDKSTVLEPLYTLLKNDVQWKWGKEQELAFNRAKALLTSDLTLVHYSLDKELHMVCDASEYGVGAVLCHKMDDGTERPVIMSSRTLQMHERRYAQIDKEALAIMFGLKKFRQYLIGRKFIIFTDHKPLLGIFGRNKPIPELVSSRMLRWALTLNSFNYELEYRPGSKMGDADSLSRWPTSSNEEHEEEDVLLIEQMDGNSQIIDAQLIAKETDKDTLLRKVKFFLLNGWPDVMENDNSGILPFYRRRGFLSLNKDCIMWANRVIIPTKLQEQVLKLLHTGHNGVVQTKIMARGYLWWPSLDKDIESMVSQCETCQLCRNNPPVTEHSWPTPTRAWSRIHVDFMGPFMDRTFLIIVDSYSKWPIIEMVSSMSSKMVINILKRVFADNGLPEVVVSDNGLAFTSKEFKEFMENNLIKHVTGAPYHPSTNGQAERTIQTIKNKFKKLPGELSWTDKIAKVLFEMRSTPSTVTGKTPAEMLNNRMFRTPITHLHPDTNILQKEERKERSIKSFKVGDNVLIRVYNTDKKWLRGVIKTRMNGSVYEVEAEDGTCHRRHVDQLVIRTTPSDITSNGTSSTNSQEDIDYEDVEIPPPEQWKEILGID